MNRSGVQIWGGNKEKRGEYFVVNIAQKRASDKRNENRWVFCKVTTNAKNDAWMLYRSRVHYKHDFIFVC